MPADPLPSLLTPRATRWLGWIVVYLVIAIGAFSYPFYPSAELDPSWRMAMGYFFEHGSQFGTEVVFTYGLLGFVMGKTYSGLQFWLLIGGQATLALITAAVFTLQLRRLSGGSRVLALGFFFLFAIIYEDALHMVVIAILGFEALRSVDSGGRVKLGLIGAVLALYAQIKFTDLMLVALVVVTGTAYAWAKRRWREGATLAVTSLAVFLGIWVGCGQALANLPAYLVNSWEVSQGYQWAMGFPAPDLQLALGLVVLGVLAAYALWHWFTHADKIRGTANLLLLTAFIYLNWKHGFIRPDGHLIGFFICAMLPLSAYPGLLDDAPRRSRLHRWVFLAAIGACLWGIEATLEGVVSQALGSFQGRVWGTLSRTRHWHDTRQQYRDSLSVAKQGADLKRTRETVGQATVDVLGSEQGVALFNKFNYRPRPVFQGYSVFTPALSRLNAAFYSSDRAPDYVLMKVQSIDARLPVMDDPDVMRLLIHRYDFQYTEGGFLIWKRKPGSFDDSHFSPQLQRTADLAIGDAFPINGGAEQPLWLRIDLPPSLLGRLRALLYRPPQVKLKITTTHGDKIEYLMPLPQGRAGFIINPLIEDYVDYLRFAGNSIQKQVAQVAIEVADGDQKFFAPTVRFEVSSLVPGKSSQSFIPKDTAKLFYMFKDYPVAYDAAVGVTVGQIDDTNVAILHAPSQMIFELPAHARTLSGQFGLLVGAYTGEGHSNGAEFVVYWSDGTRRVDLFQRFLDPRSVGVDRGLKSFSVKLDALSGGRIYIETKAGPYNDNGWDWTGWTNIRFTR